jgi:CRP-like cAMP-binding protein
LLLHSIIMALRPDTVPAGQAIINKGDKGEEMYLICHGEVEVIDGNGKTLETLRDGDFFGEISLLNSTPRIATVRAKIQSDLFVLEKSSFSRILRNHPQFAETMLRVAQDRYDLTVTKEQLMG